MLTSRIPKIRRELKVGAAERVARVAESMADDAQRLAPVDQGDLRDSIGWEMTGPTEARVGVMAGDVFYGHMVEFGTRHHAARPFMRPAAENARRDLKRHMRDLFR